LASATLTVSTTGLNAAVSNRTRARGLLYAMWLPPLIGLVVSPFGRWRKKGRTVILSMVMAYAMLAGLVLGIGCSSGGGSGGGNGTPSGTYTITVMGTSAAGSLQGSTTTTLTVN